MLVRACLSVLTLLLGLAGSARADLIVTIHDATIPAGGTGFVNVTIESTGSDPLSDFGFQFQITTAGVTRLEFVNPQPDPQLTNPNYVLFGDSFDLINGAPVGSVLTTVVPNDTFLGGDFTDSGTNVTVTTSKLLVQLQVTTQTFLPPVQGDTFTVDLNPASLPFTFFAFHTDPGNSPDLDYLNFTVIPGTVTIGPAIPEPGSFSLFFLTGAGLLLTRRLRRQ